MAGNSFGAPRDEDLDWNNLSNPVPMDLIDPEFPAHAVPADLPGSRSEILPREESEAFAAAHEAAPSSSSATSSATSPVTAPDATLFMPGPPEPGEAASQGAGTIQMPARGVPDPAGSGGTTFGGWPQDHAEIQDEFSRLRAKMEAETESEKQAKLEAEKEEASQRERLEQWMANARNRLLKADADLTGPSARIRIRKEHSPSLYRLAEMQKTIWVEGQSTQADGQAAPLRSADREAPAHPPLDPMATISVSREQFLTLDAPAQPTLREQALARQAAQQAAQLAALKQVKQAQAKQAEKQQASARPGKEEAAPPQPGENAMTAHTASRPPAAPRAPHDLLNPPQSQGGTDYHPMTREQALTRKVAQLRKVAEGGGNTLAIGPVESPQERTALHFAIAAVVIAAIVVLGVGLFAATQAGLFDGLENQIPFLRPDVPARPDRSAVRPGPSAAVPARDPASSAGARAIAPDVAPGNQPTAPVRAPAKSATPAISAVPPIPASKASVRPESARRSAAKTAPEVRERPSASAASAAPATDADGGDIPAYAKPRGKSANPGEVILRASVQAAANRDKDNLHEMYNRYALGFPGLSGEVKIGLMVDPGGRILEGSVVNSTTGVEAFDQELLRKVLDWRLRAFPESRPKFIVVPLLFPLQGR